MELATEPFNARELRIVKKKINLLHDPSIRSARLFRLAFDRGPPAFQTAGLRDTVLILLLYRSAPQNPGNPLSSAVPGRC